MEALSEFFPQIVLRVVAPLLCVCLVAWVALCLCRFLSSIFCTLGRRVPPAQWGAIAAVTVSGSFTENVTDQQILSSNSLTVVRVELRPYVTAPRNDARTRHTYGVYELVQYLQEPAMPLIIWNPVGGGTNEVVTGRTYYRCPLYGCENPLRAEVGLVRYSPRIEVKEPQGIESMATEYVVYSNQVHKGEAGGIGMRLYMYVTPLEVSFSEIAIEEVPCFTGETHGYFKNPYFNGVFAHTGGSAHAWTEGHAYMDNPLGWNVKDTSGDTPPYRQFGENIKETFMIDRHGRVGVFKFDNWVVRTTNDVVTLYGPITKKED